MNKLIYLLPVLCLVGCRQPTPAPSAGSKADTRFNSLANDYLAGYLAWRPQVGTALGLHKYDGKLTDFSADSLRKELNRLDSFNRSLGALDSTQLSPAARHDYRILQASIRREIFGFQTMRAYSHNPMTYAGVMDVNIYIKRDFAPLPDRVRSITAILKQAPRVMAAARANLDPLLPRPLVETAVEMATGAADFS